MKSYLRKIALLVICLFVTIPVLAQCPEGMSEVVVVTPSGISNTICIEDAAIPGIENAAVHSPAFVISGGCPCEAIWSEAVDRYMGFPQTVDISAEWNSCGTTDMGGAIAGAVIAGAEIELNLHGPDSACSAITENGVYIEATTVDIPPTTVVECHDQLVALCSGP